MKKGNGLRRYFYEYVIYEAIGIARDRSKQVIPISQAKQIRSQIDEYLDSERHPHVDDVNLDVPTFVKALEATLQETVPNIGEIFTEYSVKDPLFQQLQNRFMYEVGLSDVDNVSPALPISPYDPEWSQRATIKSAGNSLVYMPGDVIDQEMNGITQHADLPKYGQIMLFTYDTQGKRLDAGRSMTDEDASGLSALRDYMSVEDYGQIRQWVIDGGRDPRTGHIDRQRFMSPRALQRSIAVLQELQNQGLGYKVLRDQNPGQIKAHLTGTGMDIRLTELRENEDYAGARIYDHGTVIRYSSNYKREGGKTATYSPSPSEAVDLLRFAQGKPVQRRDLPAVVAGELGFTHPETIRKGRNGPTETVDVEDSYYGNRDSMFTYQDYSFLGMKLSQKAKESKVMLRRDASDRHLPEFFGQVESAQEYLHEAVTSSWENLAASLNVEGLITAFEAQRAEGLNLVEFDPPEYSSDSEIAAIQRIYWDVLTGERDELLRPGATTQMYEERLGMIGELQAKNPDVEPDYGNLVYGGTAEEKIRTHADEVMIELIGTAEPELYFNGAEFVDQRFDPIRVAKYMTSSKGQWANLDDLAQALRRVEATPDQIRGTGYQVDRFKNRLLQFDGSTAQPIENHESLLIRKLGETIRSSLAQNATEVGRILIDDLGVVQWQAEKMKRDGSTQLVTGQIGQIFDTGEYGEIVTQFAGGNNNVIIPGYEARIVPQKPGENKTVEKRTRLRGYEQLMIEQIQYQIANDLLSGRSEVGESSSLNRVYAQLYGTKHPVDYLENLKNSEKEIDSWTKTILKTEARRVRYSNEMKTGSTVYAEYQAAKHDHDPVDDNRFDAWQLTGGRNMAVLTGEDQNNNPAPSGYFDPIMTGGGTNQGIVRFLTEDALVDSNGHIIPGDPTTATGSRAPLMNRSELETLRFDPFDRQQMTASTIMQSAKITEPEVTAMMTFGGWTADDSIVISQDFAQKHQIRGINGELRELVVGDKLSDLHGNKGVVSLIIDRNMDLEEAKRHDLEQEVEWFRANPTMNVVMSPFSLISRRNAGSARELMGSDLEHTQHPGNGWVFGDLGRMRFIVTHMAVDEKTKIYDDEAVFAGKGRKASSQLAWALGAQACPHIMREFYGPNSGAEANLREHLISVGLDMTADGTLFVVGNDEDTEEILLVDERSPRRIFEMPELVRTSNGSLNLPAMRRGFGELIGDHGGDLEIPFPLTFPTGEQTEAVSDASWKLPVLSSHLRSGQDFEDGTSVAHDYTVRYVDIHAQACRYRQFQEKLRDLKNNQYRREILENGMRDAHMRAQRNFDAITTDIKERVLSGKTNTFKTGLMSSRLSDSATAVWSADPRLDIDQIAISPVMAHDLGFVEDDYALIWRDPVLRDAGVRYLRVAIDDRLTGVAINPVMGKCFDGDFDGDAVAVVKLHSEAAKNEAKEKLTVAANLLDTGEISDRGTHPFTTHVSLDTQVALSKSSRLRTELMKLSGSTNLAYAGRDDESIEMTRSRYEDIVPKLSDFYRHAQRHEFGSALAFDNLSAHLESIREVCVKTGAKGNSSKLAEYKRYLGDSEGQTGITREDQEASMFATAIKAHGTGLGGSYSQRAVRALRNEDLKAVLEVTYPVTQSILQSKHDAAEARHKYDMLQGPGRECWRGRKLEHLGPGVWRAEYIDGSAVQATKEEWVKQFIDFYQAKDGFNVRVNPEYVQRVADALVDSKTGLIRNLEQDASLQGTLMDRMAYGGSFTDLLAAAENHENLFDGEKNQQFCSVVTRDVRRKVEMQKQQPNPEHTYGSLTDDLVKRDVLIPGHEKAQARREHHESPVAVAVKGVHSVHIDTEPEVEYSMFEVGG